MASGTGDTAHKKRKILELFEAKAGNITELCRSVGIGRRTYYRWMEEDEKFKEKVEDAKEALIDYAESQLKSLIDDKNPAGVIFFLKTQGKKRGYTERYKFEHSGRVDSELTVKVVHVREKESPKTGGETGDKEPLTVNGDPV